MEGILLVDALRAAGAVAVERRRGRVMAVFEAPSEPSEFVRRLAGSIRASTSLVDPDLEWEVVGDEAWAELWNREMAPVDVTARIRIVPIGSEAARPGRRTDGPTRSDDRAEIEVLLLPGVAFGTPRHPTTTSCVRCLDGLVRTGDRVADVGTGSGVLAIVAALLGARRVVALDADPGACRDARRNAAANRVGDRIEVHATRMDGDTVLPGEPFDGLVANLEPPILLPILPRLVDAVGPGGWLLLSGASDSEKSRILAAVPTLAVEKERLVDGWWTVLLRIPRSPYGAP